MKRNRKHNQAKTQVVSTESSVSSRSLDRKAKICCSCDSLGIEIVRITRMDKVVVPIFHCKGCDEHNDAARIITIRDDDLEDIAEIGIKNILWVRPSDDVLGDLVVLSTWENDQSTP